MAVAILKSIHRDECAPVMIIVMFYCGVTAEARLKRSAGARAAPNKTKTRGSLLLARRATADMWGGGMEGGVGGGNGGGDGLSNCVAMLQIELISQVRVIQVTKPNSSNKNKPCGCTSCD